jgi:hypothetical protein
MATAVASPQAGDANQALDRARLNRINEDASGIGKQARSIENRPDAEAHRKRDQTKGVQYRLVA